MRSRMSRGVPEWSRGKDLYIGSPVSASGKVSGVTGIVPGPPGVRRMGPPIPEGPMGQSGEGNQPIVGWCAPLGPPHASRVGNPRVGGGLPTCLGGQGTPLAAAPPLDGVWPAPPLPGGLYKGGREGSSITALGASLLPCYTSPSRRSSAKPCRDLLHPPPRRRAAGSPSTSPSPLLDQEGGDVAAPYVC